MAQSGILHAFRIEATVGREILYCTKCGRALTADDFTRGRAHTFDHRQYCTACLPQRHDPTATPAPRPARRGPAMARKPPAVPSPPRSAAPKVLALLATLGILGLLAFLLLSVQDPAVTAAADARDFAQLHPASLDEIVRRWERAVEAAGDGAHAADSKRELERAVAARAQALAVELKELEEKIRERLEAERFGAVADVLEEARKRHAAPRWKEAIDGRIKEVRAAAEQRYPALKAKAEAAFARGAEEQVREIRAKLSVWGRPDLTADLEAALATIVPRGPLPAGAAVLLQYPKEVRPYNLAGTVKPNGLLALPYGKGAMMGGFEIIRPPFPIPVRGEFWLTYSTRSPKPVVLRFRILRGDKTVPYNWELKAPQTGGPARVKAPLRDFMNYDNQIIAVGDRVHSIYIQQDDPAAELTFIEAVIFSLPE